MKTKLEFCRAKGGSRSGAILGLVLVVMLVLSILGAGLMRMSETDSLEAASTVNRYKSFWRAEAGLHHVRCMLRNSESYRGAPWALAANDSTYAAAVAAIQGDLYTVISTGNVNGAVSVVVQDIKVHEGLPAAFEYILFGGAGSMEIRKDSVISGNVFQNGDITFSGAATVSGEVYTTQSADGYPAKEPPEPLPAMPDFDTSWYDQEIASAKASGLGSITYPISLNGQTVYVKGDDNFIGRGTSDKLVIRGPGTLVIGGNASFFKDCVIGNDVMIVCGGTFSIEKNITGGSNTVFYSAVGFDIAKNANVAIGNCMLLTPGDIETDKDFAFSGVLYALGSITSKMNLTITGCAIAGNGFDISKNPQLTYDASRIMEFLPPGFTLEIILTNILWHELDPPN